MPQKLPFYSLEYAASKEVADLLAAQTAWHSLIKLV